MKMSGNTILITGGGSGIGRGFAEAFQKLGNKVVIAGRSTKKLEETAAAIPGIETIELDVSKPASIQACVKEVKERFPALNVLINNAGIMAPEKLIDHDVQIAEDIVLTNLLGPIRLTAALLPHLTEQQNATVLNVSSGLAFVPMAAAPTYCASKAALHSYSLSLREQLRNTSVQVIEIPPPYVQTELNGEQQANDPRAMPLDEYINETMAALSSDDGIEEALTEKVKFLRHAKEQGNFSKAFEMLSEMGRELYT